MPIVLRAFILCDTDSHEEASSAVARALESEVFNSSSPVLDHVIGFEQTIDLPADGYQEGSFPARVPAAALLGTANQLPC